MAEIWYYTCEGKQMDPVPMPELKRLVGDGVLKPTDMIWKEGLPRWIRASSLEELFPDPSTSLDRYFSEAASSPAAKAEAPSPPAAKAINRPPRDDDEPRPRERRRRLAEEEEDNDRPRRRRREPTGTGSGVWIVASLLIGGVVILASFAIGILILIAAPHRPANAPQQMAVAHAPAPNEEVMPARAEEPIVGNMTYDTGLLGFNNLHDQVITVRMKETCDIAVRSTMKMAKWGLEIVDRERRNQMVQRRPGGGWRFTAEADGVYHVQLRRLDVGAPVRASVSITRQNQPPAEPKNDPALPPDVRTGVGALPIAVNLPPGAEHIVRFRVKAGHRAKVTVTPLPAPGMRVNLNLQVYKDSDNALLKEDDSPLRTAHVEFTLPETAIVRVRVHNASDKATVTRFTLVYDVGN